MINWVLGIVIATVFVVGMLVTPEQAYAPPQTPRAAFSFQGSTTDGAPEITMRGGGNWVKDGSGISAGGHFAGMGTKGSWKAFDLASATGCCTPGISGPGVVVFTATFNDADGTTLFKKVVVAANDIDLDGDGGNGVQNFWVQDFGFGTAKARFN